MMITLYHAHHSTCSQKVRIALAEKGLEFESKLVDLASKGQLEPEYLKINPNGVVPTLVHDGQPIIDSSVICEYLDEVCPEPPLSGRDAVSRARVRAWMRFLEEVPTYAVRVPSFNRAFLNRFDGLSSEEFVQQQAGPRPLRKHFYLKMSEKGFDKDAVQESVDQLTLTCQRMQRALEKGPWLAGESFSLADVVAAPLIDRTHDLGMSWIWDEDYPLVAGWFDRLQQRPAYAKAMYPGARLSETHQLRALLAEAEQETA
ncbi:glutathione S-transferase family protein [Rhodobacteraceae bacterium 2CG4]|uniref:Glutathione S-transferase family protein n=1 Tax=Halovulum marinum TaxID=2662447 RepID=A0A6L5YXM2_9RHOB|nr:glutathione S-transferase family protein [Halovulum marinum]MSU88612.1 glutathione S-transferase family protein [Halovulum marinum]